MTIVIATMCWPTFLLSDTGSSFSFGKNRKTTGIPEEESVFHLLAGCGASLDSGTKKIAFELPLRMREEAKKLKGRYRDRDGLQSSHIIRVAKRVFTRGTSIVQVPRVMDGNHASSSAPGAGSNGALVLVIGSNGRDRGVLVAMSVTDRLASHVITAVEGITLETVMYMINVHVPV